ncbi:MAG: hypothetical protein BWK79_14460 [Beggiatoa sp. IS2]|nr:MAG: hypothetical protein BWK79_14460 [Beggiatoa sp. IS2]
MFKPLSMQRVSIQLLTEDAPLVAQVLAQCGVFNPETVETEVANQLPDLLGGDFRSVFNSARHRLDKILIYFTLNPLVDSELSRPVSLVELEVVDNRLGDIWQQFSKLADQLHQLQEQQTHFKQLLETLQLFSELDLDLRLLQEPKQFLNVHLGTVPLANFVNLQPAMELAEHFIQVFYRDDHTVYFVLMGPLNQQEQVHSVLEHAEFRPLTIPTAFKNHPQQVHADLMTQTQYLQQQMKAVSVRQDELTQEHYATVANAYLILNWAAPYAVLTDTLRGRGQLALIEGWIPRTDLPQLDLALKEKLDCPYVLSHRPPRPVEYPRVPSLIRHHPAWESFATLVKNYGIPRYGEFDPTLWFAVSFLLMFGMMFGDVGHGAVIAASGWYFSNRLKTFSLFFISAGASSLFFGLLYGSCFGFEEKLFPALWLAPIQNASLMLTVALYWGMGFILLATGLTIINRWHEGEYAAALFDNRGFAGILLLLGGFYAIKQWMTTGLFESHQQLATLLPLAMILGYKWHENKLPFGERLLVTFIEGFESIINYLANTLSFLRVAAFSLNHVALAIAVFTLADMLDTTGQIITIILGNVFIIGFEGAIVTIQILRLEYYEGFSRFFKGDGRAFRPLTIGLK